MAAFDITAVAAEFPNVISAVASVGVVALFAPAIIKAFKLFRETLGVPQVDHWAGYTAADDARDRAAAGLGANPGWLESAREHAMQMQLTGEGQSDAYATYELERWQDDESERPSRGGQ
jgi:hypothetical protein